MLEYRSGDDRVHAEVEDETGAFFVSLFDILYRPLHIPQPHIEQSEFIRRNVFSPGEVLELLANPFGFRPSARGAVDPAEDGDPERTAAGQLRRPLERGDGLVKALEEH